eukprot:6607208-Prymnesium_polylepis.1
MSTLHMFWQLSELRQDSATQQDSQQRLLPCPSFIRKLSSRLVYQPDMRKAASSAYASSSASAWSAAHGSGSDANVSVPSPSIHAPSSDADTLARITSLTTRATAPNSHTTLARPHSAFPSTTQVPATVAYARGESETWSALPPHRRSRDGRSVATTREPGKRARREGVREQDQAGK